ncbi:3179_t:CDS:2, partial [Acaulospora morrowiae]
CDRNSYCLGFGACANCPISGQIGCGGNCTDPNTDSGNCGDCDNACPGGKYCSGGKCVCLPQLTDCSGTCVDLTSNNNNCKACGNKCGSNQSCCGG